MSTASSVPTIRRMRIGDLVAAVLAVGALAAGCGEDEVVSTAGQPIALEQLSRSADASAEATSGRSAFDMTLRLPGADEPMSFSGEGAFESRAVGDQWRMPAGSKLDERQPSSSASPRRMPSGPRT